MAVLVSGGGTNFQALLDAQESGALQHGSIVLAVSDRPAYALERAAKYGVQARLLNRRELGVERLCSNLSSLLDEFKVDVIILAGFLSILSEDIVRRYKGRIVNIHPSLLPAFGGKGFYGLKVHEAALARGVKITGATAHIVNEITDGGEILMQKAVEVMPGDTPQSLQRRVMEQAEWELLPRAAERICRQFIQERIHESD